MIIGVCYLCRPQDGIDGLLLLACALWSETSDEARQEDDDRHAHLEANG